MLTHYHRNLFEWVLCWIIYGLSKDIQCHILAILFSMIPNHHIRLHATCKWAVDLVIADGHLLFLQGFCGYVWINTHILSPYRVLASKAKPWVTLHTVTWLPVCLSSLMYDFDRSTMHNYSTVGGDEGCRVGEVLPSSLTISVLSYSKLSEFHPFQF